MKNKVFSRRKFLKLASMTGLILYSCAPNVRNSLVVHSEPSQPLDTSTPSPTLKKQKTVTTIQSIPETGTGTAAESTTATYLPVVTRELPGPKVIHVHAPSATNWDFSSSWYGNYVNQTVINFMVDTGIKELTGRATVADAWKVILPNYQSGNVIAVKVNLNNGNCDDQDNNIDALMEPVNALIAGMKQIGVQESDVYIYDSSRSMPARFRSRCQFSQVCFYDAGCGGGVIQATFNKKAAITFNSQYFLNAVHYIPDLLVDAKYLINVPILEDHDISGVTLGLKNHYGSINWVVSSNDERLHDFIRPGNPDYNPIVDIYANPNIRAKTRLTVGDGLFGKYGHSVNSTPPTRWQSFNNQAPNSLFFSTDPVAIDCVMIDILDTEPVDHPCRPDADNYLKLATKAGLGTYERSKPDKGYSIINYRKISI